MQRFARFAGVLAARQLGIEGRVSLGGVDNREAAKGGVKVALSCGTKDLESNKRTRGTVIACIGGYGLFVKAER